METICLQVDYESEEEETDEEEKEDQGELEEESTEQDNLQDVRPETAEATGVRGRRDGKKEEESPHQMRVNAVLQASPAIQRYSFDQEHQLWCEVRLTAFPQLMKMRCYSTLERDSTNHCGFRILILSRDVEQQEKGFSITKVLQKANEIREQVWVLVLIPYLVLYHTGFSYLVTVLIGAVEDNLGPTSSS